MEEDTGKMKRREFLAGLGAAATIGSALTQIGPRADAQAPAPPTMVASPDPPSAMVPVNWAGPASAPAAPDEIPTYPSSNTPNYEYYDYQDSMANRGEFGNNYYLNSPLTPRATNTNKNSLLTLTNLETHLGTWGTVDGGTGIIASELNATLVGTGTGGTSLKCVLLETARPAYFVWLGQTTCTAPPCT
jgi:hypothetical protein